MSDTLSKFKEFLTARGAEILAPTNKYERVRFRANGQVSVMYEGRRGYSFVGEAEAAWDDFNSGGRLKWHTDSRKASRNRLNNVIRTLLDRDGDCCFYCKKVLGEAQMSVEHLLALAHGGSHHISNKVLAHPACNGKAGHLSVMEKIRIRETA